MYIASESTMYRILKNENMQHHRGRSKKPAPRSKPDTYIASDSNQVWTWDITYLNTFVRGLYYKLYMILDIFSRKIVGWEVWPEESGEYAAVLVERAFVDEKIGNAPLVLHSDNGSPMKALTLKTKLESLGIISSYSRPRVSNDNPYSEALFRTCKYCSEYPTEGFESVDSAREWVNGFVEWYNNKHYHSGLNFVTHDKSSKTTKDFFAKVQNKMHFAIHGYTAAEVIYKRAQAEKPHMGLTTWKDAPDGKIIKSDVSIAKNFLTDDEISSLERIVSAYLDLAEDRAKRHVPMTMEDWANRLDIFLQADERAILKDAGSITARIAKLHAETEFEKYRIIQDRLFESDYDKYILELEEEAKKR
jgi:transposase InsO family protein